MLESIFTTVVGGDQPGSTLRPEQIVCRAVILYLGAVLLVRLGKSRLLTRAAPIDGILTIMLGALLGGAIIGTSPMSHAMVAVATLIAVHWICTGAAYLSKTCGCLLKGNAYVLVADGEINWLNMRRAHISHDDLLEELRLNANVTDLSQVKLAVKERSGSVGTVKNPAECRVVDVAVEKGVQTVRLVI